MLYNNMIVTDHNNDDDIIWAQTNRFSRTFLSTEALTETGNDVNNAKIRTMYVPLLLHWFTRCI